MTPKEAVSRNVRLARHLKGWTLEEMGDRCGWSRQAQWEAETGKRSWAIGDIAKVAGALGVPVALLIEGVDD